MTRFPIFEKYSHTTEKMKKEKIHPIKIRLSQGRTFDMIKEYFKSLEPLDTVVAEEYYDICILDQKEFEISVQLLSGDGSTYINVSVYGARKRGKTRKRLYQVLDDLRKVFSQYL